MRKAVSICTLLGLGHGISAGAARAGEVMTGQPRPWQLNLQPPASPVMSEMWDFWLIMLGIITAITVFVLLLMIYVMWRFSAKRNPQPTRFSHNTPLEVVWTVVPIIILLVIVFPSFKLHYFLDVVPESELTVKAIGNQFFWTHEYPDEGISFDSVMLDDEDLAPGQPRLLEVDNRVVIPVGTTVRIIVTASGVIHSWAIPAFGVKIDAIPGRLNETWIRAKHEGVFYGQCSELCGAGHGYMPIAVEVVSKVAYRAWLETAKREFAAVGTPAELTVASSKNE